MIWMLLVACGQARWTPPEVVPPGPCPAGMVQLGGGRAVLGDIRETYGEDQVVAVAVDVAPYCVDAYPFPGRAGDPWPQDGLEGGRVEAWVALLAHFDRRFCTAEELLWAAGYGPANRRFLTGRYRGALCEPEFSWGDMKPLGAYPKCRNPFGLHDHNVVSTWVSASRAVDDARDPVRRRPYSVLGGTNREDTFYANDNFGLHNHDPGDIPFGDDQLRVCADPGAGADDAGWALFVEAAAHQGTFEGALQWWWAHPHADTADVLAPVWTYVPEVWAVGETAWSQDSVIRVF